MSIQSVLANLEKVFTATDVVLNEWTGTGNLQFPVLMNLIAIKMNWDEKQIRENDPFVRYYVRSHPEWTVTRGAHGGIMRVADKNKKATEKNSSNTVRNKLKEEMKATIEAKVSTAPEIVQSAQETVNINNSSSELKKDLEDDSGFDLDEVLEDR